MVEPITSFSGQYKFLSNFFPRRLVYNGAAYPSAEHAFQAAKALTKAPHDLVASAPTPALAKRYGRSVVCRHDWDEIKRDVMLEILRAKFTKFTPLGHYTNPLAVWLRNTGDAELIEGNTWGDTYWGQCPLGNGENHLGKLLMQVRQEIL